jgi:hypothetical protein
VLQGCLRGLFYTVPSVGTVIERDHEYQVVGLNTCPYRIGLKEKALFGLYEFLSLSEQFIALHCSALHSSRPRFLHLALPRPLT